MRNKYYPGNEMLLQRIVGLMTTGRAWRSPRYRNGEFNKQLTYCTSALDHAKGFITYVPWWRDFTSGELWRILILIPVWRAVSLVASQTNNDGTLQIPPPLVQK